MNRRELTITLAEAHLLEAFLAEREADGRLLDGMHLLDRVRDLIESWPATDQARLFEWED